MHKQYGSIIRISPDEIHINDPSFIDAIFTGPGHIREKGQLTLNGLGNSPTAIATRSHALHKSRRAALAPFFSSANIRRLEPMIHEVLFQIFLHLERGKKEGNPVNMSLLYKAATHDLIADYAFGQGSICFSREDLNQPYFQAYHEMVMTWHFGCYFPQFNDLVRRLPMPVVTRLVPKSKAFITMIQAAVKKIDNIKTNTSDSDCPTIFHGLLSSPLPESEKSSARLAEEASVLLSAGTDSSANTLAAITYHLLSNPSILQKLQQELRDAIPDRQERQFPSFNKVETLPYLSAIIQEGLRLHPAVAGRQQRVAPAEDLVYTSPSRSQFPGISYKLPKGTVMSMSPHLLSRIEEIYPEPMEFRPERFLGEEGKALRGLGMAFSKGGRMCLGMQLAYQEMFVLLAGIFGRFDEVEGEGEALELFGTERGDVEIVRDLVTENVRDGSVGVMVRARGRFFDL